MSETLEKLMLQRLDRLDEKISEVHVLCEAMATTIFKLEAVLQALTALEGQGPLAILRMLTNGGLVNAGTD